MSAAVDQTCLFCRIGAGEISSHRVYESSRVLAFLDIHPIRDGHVQIIPRQHYAYFDDLPPDVVSEIFHVAQRLAPILRRTYGVPRVALFFTGVDIAHAHAHVVPMLEATDVTSTRYIVETPLTFRQAPLAQADDLARVAQALTRSLNESDA